MLTVSKYLIVFITEKVSMYTKGTRHPRKYVTQYLLQGMTVNLSKILIKFDDEKEQKNSQLPQAGTPAQLQGMIRKKFDEN